MMATQVTKTRRDTLVNKQRDVPEITVTHPQSELTLKTSLVERQFDPFLLQAILIKLQIRRKKFQFLHDRIVDRNYRRLHARYTEEKQDNRRLSETIETPEVIPKKTCLDVSAGKLDMLAKRITHLRRSFALVQKKPSDDTRRYNKITSQMARHRWQVAIGLVMGMAKMAGQNVSEKSEPLIYGDLTYQSDLFKANRNVFVLSADSKFVLTQIPEKRTKEQVEEVALNLRRMGIKSFCEYPISIQLKLVQIARFEVLTPLRVIIRQGRPAENFFFLIDGTVVAIERIRSPEGISSEELIFLKKGAMFGETEMVNRLNHRASVISKDYVEMLTIERNDLLKIFENRRHMTRLPDHIRFLRQCQFIELWPLDILVNDLDHCTPYFFKQNVLIVEDSMRNDFLVVIRSGNCRVIRKLYVDRLLLEQNQEKKSKAEIRANHFELLQDNFKCFSNPGSKFNQVFHPKRLEESLNTITDVTEIIGAKRFGKKWKKHLEPLLSYKTTKKVSVANSAEDLQDKEKRKYIEIGSEPKTRLEKALLLPTTQETLLNENKKDRNNTLVPIYVQIDILNRTEVFGLETLVFDRLCDKQSNTGLVLLSGDDEEGVHVVLLSKSFFVDHAPEEVQWRVRQMMKTYPTCETLEKEIQRPETWEDYKQGVNKSIIEGKPRPNKKPLWK